VSAKHERQRVSVLEQSERFSANAGECTVDEQSEILSSFFFGTDTSNKSRLILLQFKVNISSSKDKLFILEISTIAHKNLDLLAE
jgi:hypothetical protein